MPFLNRHGWPPTVTAPTAERLRAVAAKLETFGMLAHSAVPVVKPEDTPAEQLALTGAEAS